MDWKKFWEEYRNDSSEDNQDRYLQVGKTINKKPINKGVFNWMIEDINTHLELTMEDTLLEMCCGNGLLTEQLAERVRHINAFDFTERFIKVARENNPHTNICYEVGDAKGNLKSIFTYDSGFTKVLMNDSLGYFNKEELVAVIKQIRQKDLRFYITGIPADALKWEFYNTDERKEHYFSQLSKGDQFFDGIGRWWKLDDLLEVARELDLYVSIFRQPKAISSFRVNVLFWS
jgi:SAM-dependent methyltransferase